MGGYSLKRHRCACGGQFFVEAIPLLQNNAGCVSDIVHSIERKWLCIYCGLIWGPSGDGEWETKGQLAPPATKGWQRP